MKRDLYVVAMIVLAFLMALVPAFLQSRIDRMPEAVCQVRALSVACAGRR